MDEDTATNHRTEPRYCDLPSRLPECLQQQLDESDVHLDDSLSTPMLNVYSSLGVIESCTDE